MENAGGKWNQVVYWSRPLGWKNQTLTPNPDTIYLFPFYNTNDAGPMVLEIPPADGGSITGTIDEGWQGALEDVGPAGVDKGKGGKYLILPPNYKDQVPEGYIALPRDRAMIDQLKSIGIEKGKPFSPDQNTQAILSAAAREAHNWLDARCWLA